MANDEKRMDDRDVDAVPDEQQRESSRNDQQAAQGKSEKGKTAKSSIRRENAADDQVRRSDKKEPTRGSRGPEDWGGYQGY